MNVNNWNPPNMRGRGNRRPFGFRGRGMGRPPWQQGMPRPVPWGAGYTNPYNRCKYNQKYFLQRPPVAPKPLFPPPKPPSPLPGSEEYTQRNIQQASDLIKRQLNLDGKSEGDIDNNQIDMFAADTNETENNNSAVIIDNVEDIVSDSEQQSKKVKQSRTNKPNKPVEQLNVHEIHDKIIKHISNLSHSKKINLVNNAGMASYDPAIQQIQKQKRLELSRALRDMSNKSIQADSGDVINAIIPDFDIKLEDLSLEVISQLSSTLDTDISRNLVDPEECFKKAHQLLNSDFDEEVLLSEDNYFSVEPEEKLAVSDTTLLNISDPFDFEYFNKPVEEFMPSETVKIESGTDEKDILFCADFNPNRSYLSQPTSSNDEEVNKNSLGTFNIKVRTDLQAKNISDSVSDNCSSDKNEYFSDNRFNEKLSAQTSAQSDIVQFADSPSLVSPGNSVRALSERSFVNNCESSQSFTSQNKLRETCDLFESTTDNYTSTKMIPNTNVLSSSTASVVTSEQFSGDNLLIKDVTGNSFLNNSFVCTSKKKGQFSFQENIPTSLVSSGIVDENYSQVQQEHTNLATKSSIDMSEEYEQFINQIAAPVNLNKDLSLPLNVETRNEVELPIEKDLSNIYSPNQLFNESPGNETDKKKSNVDCLGKAKVELWLKSAEFTAEKVSEIASARVTVQNSLVPQVEVNEIAGKVDKQDENRSKKNVDLAKVIHEDKKSRNSPNEIRRSEYEIAKDAPGSSKRNNDKRKDDRFRRDEDRSKKEDKMVKDESKTKIEDDRYKEFKLMVESRSRNEDKPKNYESRPRSREERHRVHEKCRNSEEKHRKHDENLRNHESRSKPYCDKLDRVKDEVRNHRDNRRTTNSPKKPSMSPGKEKDSRSNYFSKGSSWERISSTKNLDRNLVDKKSSNFDRSPPRDRNINRSWRSPDKRNSREKEKVDSRERPARAKINDPEKKAPKNTEDKNEYALVNSSKKFVIPKLDTKSKNEYNKRKSREIVGDFNDKEKISTNTRNRNHLKAEKISKTRTETQKEVKQEIKTTPKQEKDSKNNKRRAEEGEKTKTVEIITDKHKNNSKKIHGFVKSDVEDKQLNSKNNEESVPEKALNDTCPNKMGGNLSLVKKEIETKNEDDKLEAQKETISEEISKLSKTDIEETNKNIFKTEKIDEGSSKLNVVDSGANQDCIAAEIKIEDPCDSSIETLCTNPLEENNTKEVIKIENSTITCDKNSKTNEVEPLNPSIVTTNSNKDSNVKKLSDKDLNISENLELSIETKGNTKRLKTKTPNDVKSLNKKRKKSPIDCDQAKSGFTFENEISCDTIKSFDDSKPFINTAEITSNNKKQITEVLNTQIFQINQVNLTQELPNNYPDSCKPKPPKVTRKPKRFGRKNFKEISAETEDVNDKCVEDHGDVNIVEETVIPKKLTRNQKKLLEAVNKIEEPLHVLNEAPKPKRFKKGVNVIQNINLDPNALMKKVWKSAGEKKLLPFNLPAIEKKSGTIENVELKFEAEDYQIVKHEPVDTINDVPPSLFEPDLQTFTMSVQSDIEDNVDSFEVKKEIHEDMKKIVPDIIEPEPVVNKTRSGINRSKSNARPKSKQKKNISSEIVNTKRKLEDDDNVPNKVIKLDINMAEKYLSLISVETQTEPIIIQENENFNNFDISNMRSTLQYMQTVDEQIESLLKFRKHLYDKLMTNVENNTPRSTDNLISPKKEVTEFKEEITSEIFNTPVMIEPPLSTPPPKNIPEVVDKSPQVEHNFRGLRKKPGRSLTKRTPKKKQIFEFSSIDECIDTVVKHFSEDLQDLGYPKSLDVEVSNTDTDVESTCSSVLSSNKQLSIKLQRYDMQQLEALKQSISKQKTPTKKEYKLKDYIEFESRVLTVIHSEGEDGEVKDVDNNLLSPVANIACPRDIEFNNWTGSILVIKVVNTMVLAANDKGVLYFYDLLDGELKNSLNLGSKPLTSLVLSSKKDDITLHVGSLDGNIYKVSYGSQSLIKSVPVEDPIQCMELGWGYIFLGSHKGNLIRYHIEKETVEDENIISSTSVLVLRATQEGARRVLLVATRNCAVSVRDAMSGLLLRTLEGTLNPTVYTLLYYNNYIYCGTSQHDVLVYTFQDGQLVFKHEQSNTSGVVCMSIVKNLLFVGCYNGNIYVYNTSTNEFITSMSGPGGLFLSMEVTGNMVIAGTKQNHFKAWPLPQLILDQMTI